MNNQEIDFELTPFRTTEDPEGLSGFGASLNCRQITYFGVTEHAAIRAMVNGVAELVASGALDPSDPFAPGGLDTSLAVGQ